MIKNRDQIDQAGRAFYWRRNPNESPMIAESTRPDIVIGFREGYEEALRDVKAALEPQESPSSPFKDHRYWSRLKEKEVRKFKLDDSFKKALEDAVVSDTPAWSWIDRYREEYDKFLASGLLWEFHPTWTGDWDKDKYAFCYNRGWEKTDTQDPAVCNYSGLRPVEGYKEEEIKKEDIDFMYKWIREKSNK